MQTIQVKDIVIGGGIPKVCVPMTGNTLKELIKEAEYFTTLDIDLVEWRVDFFEGVSNITQVMQVLEKIREILEDIPLIFTFRSAKEGGETEITLDSYIELNEAVIESGKIDIIDLELFQGEEIVKRLSNLARNHKVVTIVSNHDFQKTPSKEEIMSRLKRAEEIGGDIPKIAVMPHHPGDVLTLLQATWEMKSISTNQPIITMAMGSEGIISRLSGQVFGSDITFGAAKNASAPGQINVQELQQVLSIIHKNL